MSPKVARKLVKDGMVIGVQLEYTPYGKEAFLLQFLCVHEGNKKAGSKDQGRGESQGVWGEVHLDLWGKLLVES